MFAPFSITTDVRRFDGQNGWHYLPFDDKTSKTLRPQAGDVITVSIEPMQVASGA